LITTQSVTDALALFMTQDLYPKHQVDAELFDGENNGQKEPASDDAEGKGGSSAELIAPNPIRSSAVGQIHHSAPGQVDADIPSGSGQKRKRVPLASKRKPSKSSTD
jgi:hypothetical protein